MNSSQTQLVPFRYAPPGPTSWDSQGLGPLLDGALGGWPQAPRAPQGGSRPHRRALAVLHLRRSGDLGGLDAVGENHPILLGKGPH